MYAEVAGCGASSDAHNMVIPSPDPEPATAAMQQALADARVEPADLQGLAVEQALADDIHGRAPGPRAKAAASGFRH